MGVVPFFLCVCVCAHKSCGRSEVQYFAGHRKSITVRGNRVQHHSHDSMLLLKQNWDGE